MRHAARVSTVTALLIVVASGASAIPTGYRPPTIDTAAEAAVAITMSPDGDGDPASAPVWTGFFVNGEGVILTDASFIAPCRGSGGGPELSVTVGDDPSSLKQLPASVVACDRGRSLALLRTDHQAASWLRIGKINDLRSKDRVWLTAALSALASDDGSAEDAVRAGTVTKLNTDAKKRTISFETDLDSLDGFVGGPVIDLNGSVIGVVTRPIDGAGNPATAISPVLLSEFVRAMMVRVLFEPTPRVSVSRPTQVSAEPIIATLGGVAGSVTVTGSDIDDLELALEDAGGVWRGTIPPIERIPERPLPEYYTASVKFVDQAGKTVFLRHLRLESDLRAPRKSAAEERALRGEMTLSDIAKNRSLGVRKEYVIDADGLSWYSSNLVGVFPPQRYDQLSTSEDEETVTVYDLCHYAADLARRNLPAAQSFLDQNMRDLEVYTKKLKELDVVFCEDDKKWYYQKDASCQDVFVPWEADLTQEDQRPSW